MVQELSGCVFPFLPSLNVNGITYSALIHHSRLLVGVTDDEGRLCGTRYGLQGFTPLLCFLPREIRCEYFTG